MARARQRREAHGVLRLPLGPRAPAPAAKRAWVATLLAVLVSVGLALGPGRQWVRALSAACALSVGAFVHRRLVRCTREPRGWLIADDRCLRRIEAGRETRLVDWNDGIGTTVLARADRARFALALTSPRSTRFVPVCVTDADAGTLTPTLFERAATVAESDLSVDESISLCASDAERLLQTIAARVPGALDRMFLVDASGEPIVLERAELRVGSRRIDLSAPLEWRAFIYQELGSHAASLCQATWVRQGDGELFLVAPMPADTAWLHAAPDAWLMHAVYGEPPPRELRRAIDHLFMLPLRRALERAPHVARVPSSSSISRSERHV